MIQLTLFKLFLNKKPSNNLRPSKQAQHHNTKINRLVRAIKVLKASTICKTFFTNSKPTASYKTIILGKYL